MKEIFTVGVTGTILLFGGLIFLENEQFAGIGWGMVVIGIICLIAACFLFYQSVKDH